MNEKALAALAEKLGCGVCENEPLSAHTTFRTGGPCTCMIMPKSAEDLSQLVKFAAENGVRTLVMGKGSNMLCADEGFDGAVLLIGSDFSEITMLDDCTIRAQAGAAMGGRVETFERTIIRPERSGICIRHTRHRRRRYLHERWSLRR